MHDIGQMQPFYVLLQVRPWDMWSSIKLQNKCSQGDSPDFLAHRTAASGEGKLEGLCFKIVAMWGREARAVPSTTSITTSPSRLAIAYTANTT